MLFSAPVPFAEALQSRDVRNILPTTLSSAELEKISGDILERAIFSAQVTNAEYLQLIDDLVRQYVNGEIDLASARLALKDKLNELGYEPSPDEEGGLKDFSSDARINLVLRTNAQMAAGYGSWMQGQHPAILDQWPAQELIRVAPRKVPRNWISRWGQAGGQSYGGRMMARKNDDIWTRISRFGTPYPPFDFNSGMGVRDVDHDTALSLGVIDADTVIEPQTRDFNQDLQFSPDVRAEALRQVLIDEGLSFEGDVLTP
jgi:hypothetical protein